MTVISKMLAFSSVGQRTTLGCHSLVSGLRDHCILRDCPWSASMLTDVRDVRDAAMSVEVLGW